MNDYKSEFIDFLLDAQALKVDGEWPLQSGRKSPYFFNLGDINDGRGISIVAAAYASALHASRIHFDHLYGIPEKGVGLVAPVALKLYENHNQNVHWFFTRKVEKTHGEASVETGKAKIVGRLPTEQSYVADLDDVFTDGASKYAARETLFALGVKRIPLTAIALDRQEVEVDGFNAVETYERDTGIKVVSIVTASDVLARLKQRNFSSVIIGRLEQYLGQYGTSQAKVARR